jgi:hypothetical protein
MTLTPYCRLYSRMIWRISTIPPIQPVVVRRE